MCPLIKIAARREIAKMIIMQDYPLHMIEQPGIWVIYSSLVISWITIGKCNVVVEPFPESDTALSHAVAACPGDWNLETKLFSVTFHQALTQAGHENLESTVLANKNTSVLNGQLLLGNCIAPPLSCDDGHAGCRAGYHKEKYYESPSLDVRKHVEILCTYLKPIYDDAASILVTTRSPTVITFVHELRKIQADLARAVTSEDPFVADLTKPMLEKIDKCWKDCCQVLAMAEACGVQLHKNIWRRSAELRQVSTVPSVLVSDLTNREKDKYKCSSRPEIMEASLCAKDWPQCGSAPISNVHVKMEVSV
ncbi:hypothetical protein MLD38_014422 [Melastoma candidum]|uniref:Uncharacterized protein n=1 Tax=Melastoma candidum TaxID=119954 RepID=A0ACB9RFU1_9MYRT|nr:hypothetical protein MLD38_014422 [Melastoma candidum]